MLQFDKTSSLKHLDPGVEVSLPSESFQTAMEFLRRQYKIILLAAGLTFLLGVIYVLTSQASYTATATLFIDSNKVSLFQQQSMFTNLGIDTGGVDSQVEIIKSENIALAVIKKLKLTDDPEFTGSGGGLLGTLFQIIGLAGSNGPRSEFALSRQAVGAFQSRLSVRRVGLTSVIEIGFRSQSPERAAAIANAVADAYIDDQLEAKYQSARRAGVWLQERLTELREQASTAERAVVAFKNSNNMVDAGGRTINEQQLAELNSQLVLAQSQTAEARARMDRVQSILASNSPEAAVASTVADTLKSEVINKLRSQYLELARREADWTVRYGSSHLAVVNLRNQMRELQNSIRDELQRIAETYKSDYEISKQREDSLQKQLGEAVSQSRVTNKAQVALRELESSAQTYRALYDNFLQRYMESVQQQSFPITEARVISAASRPLFPSHPKTRLILMVSTVIGLALGIAAGAWRDLADRVFRTRNQVETILHAECIALVPALRGDGQKAQPADWKVPADQKPPDRPVKVGKTDDAARQSIVAPAGAYSLVLDSPFSAFAEAIRSIKVAIDLTPNVEGAKIVGFTSSVPNEGKSTVAAALARLAAHAGSRVLLADCDLKNPSLSRLLARTTTNGLLEVMKGQASLESVLWSDRDTGMKFLPVAMRGRLAHSSEVLASPEIRRFFDSLRSSYDYILMDLAPLMPIVDVRASTQLVDGYLYVVEWGKTRTDYAEQALSSARGVYERLLGVVLNKVDLRSMGRYDGHGSSYYYHGHYMDRYNYSE